MPLLAVLLALVPQQFEPFPPTPFDRVIRIVIDENDAVLAGHGHAERVTYKAEFSGTLHLWTKAAGELDLCLRVETPGGELVQEDDNSGGGKTPYVKLEVEPGRELVIVTAVALGEGVGSLQLCAIAAPETDETRAVADAAKLAIAEVERLHEVGDVEAARSVAMRGIAECSTIGGATSSELLASMLWRFAFETHEGALRVPTASAWRQTLRHRLRTLPDEHPDLQSARLNLAATIQALGDLRGARELGEEVLSVRARVFADDHAAVQTARQNLALTLRLLGDLEGARALEQHVLEVRLRTLPEEDADVQLARQRLALTIKELGDFEGARVLEERVLEIRSHTLPEQHPDVQAARMNLAGTLRALGNLKGARMLFERVLEIFTQTLPEGHRDLQAARLNLALTMKDQGDLQAARSLELRVFEDFSRTLPDEDPDLQVARLNLAQTFAYLGDARAARPLEERVLAVFLRTLPEEHPNVQTARQNLAATLKSLGDFRSALALEERALEMRLRSLPEDHLDVQRVRLNLAGTLKSLGDLSRARALQERVLDVFTRKLPEDHPDLQLARTNLAGTDCRLGDLQRARLLYEQVLDVRSRTLPEDHPDLQIARCNLAGTLFALGDPAAAHVLFERVLDIYSRTLSDEAQEVQDARSNLAVTLLAIGDAQRARVLQESGLEVRSLTLAEDDPNLQRARGNLAATLRAIGEFERARTLEERVLEIRSRTLAEEDPDLQHARMSLAATVLVQASSSLSATVCGNATGPEIARESDMERAGSLLRALSEAQAHVARGVLLSASGREAESRCRSLTDYLDFTLTVALGFGGLDPCVMLGPAAFLYSESTRDPAVSSSALERRAAHVEGYTAARANLLVAAGELARLAHTGTNSEGYLTALSEREGAERALVELGRKASGGELSVELDLDTLRAALKPGVAALAYRRYSRSDLKWPEAPNSDGHLVPEEIAVESLCVFIIGRNTAAETSSAVAAPTLLDLGPIANIREAAEAWRAAIGVDLARGSAVGGSGGDLARERGEKLRELVFDPLLAHVGDARHLVVVADDVLHLVPFDALPLDVSDVTVPRTAAPGANPQSVPGVAQAQSSHAASSSTSAPLVGDRYRIEVRATLGELLDSVLPLTQANTLLSVGGVSYNSEPVSLDAEDLAALEPEAKVGAQVASLVRGTTWERGFEPLPYTGQEARGIEALYSEVFDTSGTALLLEKRKASRAALQSLAPRARWLHIATHGWFAPESIRSWEDRDPLDSKSGLAFRQSGEETVKGMSPMLLCGLALAGANLPEDAVGRAPGLLTADELSTLDLSNCELAVLSACDTARGEMRRAGQGVASLQKALQIAGARSVITSLWKVPDEATKDLMLDFYRRLWVDKKPKWQALWEAKTKLRNAKDERGAPKYTTRDWAAWVLTGEPN